MSDDDSDSDYGERIPPLTRVDSMACSITQGTGGRHVAHMWHDPEFACARGEFFALFGEDLTNDTRTATVIERVREAHERTRVLIATEVCNEDAKVLADVLTLCPNLECLVLESSANEREISKFERRGRWHLYRPPRVLNDEILSDDQFKHALHGLCSLCVIDLRDVPSHPVKGRWIEACVTPVLVQLPGEAWSSVTDILALRRRILASTVKLSNVLQ